MLRNTSIIVKYLCVLVNEIEGILCMYKGQNLTTSIRCVLRQNIGPHKITGLRKIVIRTKKG